MTYPEFVQNVKETLEKDLGVSVEITTLFKSNDVKKVGLVFRDERENGFPVVYLDRFYEQDMSVEYTVLQLKSLYQQCKPNIPHQFLEIVEHDFPYDAVKDKIGCRLINKEMNKEYLKDVPYLDFMDLAIVFHLFYKDEQSMYQVTVKQWLFDKWNVTVNELYEQALNNNERISPLQFMPLDEVVKNIAEENGWDWDEMDDSLKTSGLYRLSNIHEMYGANALLFSVKLKEVADILNGNYYIIPSSVHELLIMPEQYFSSEENMKLMIQQVNDNEVSNEEILSYHFYYYDRMAEKVSMF